MKPDELQKAHRKLGLSANGAAKFFRVADGRTVRRWWSGERDIPGPVIVLTDALLRSSAVREFFGITLDSKD